MSSTKMTHGPSTLGISSRTLLDAEEQKQDFFSHDLEPFPDKHVRYLRSIECRLCATRRPRDEGGLGICLRRQVRPEPDQQQQSHHRQIMYDHTYLRCSVPSQQG